MPLALIHQALAAILLIAFALPWARADGGVLPIPPLTSPVIDQTGTLSAPDKAALEAQLQSLERTRGAQVVVLMVATTAPEDIAAFANRVGNAWKIGRRDVGDGVLVIVAKNDRKMRIEVAKALEGAVPDIAAARIIDETMKPRFRQGDFAGGLSAAVTQLSARIAGEALPAPDSTSTSQNPGSDGQEGFDWTDLAVFLFFGVIVAGPVVRGIFGAGLGGLLMGGGVGFLAFAVTSSVLVAGGAGLAALLYTWIISGSTARSGYSRAGRGGGASGGWGTGGGWGGGSSGNGGGGFSSGGGGDFGGGGASGDW